MKKGKNNSHFNHLWMMLIGCVVMFAAFYFLVSSEKVGWIWVLFLLCPLMHIFMMKGYHGHDEDGGKDTHNGHNHERSSSA